MCTVTYLPTQGGFILTHNRDEAPARSAPTLGDERRGGRTLIFPRDAEAGGAWIVANDAGRVACLLNGAFERHERRPPYRRSRGLVLLDSFDYAAAADFMTTYDLEDIEPFTYLSFENGAPTELRWDGARRHIAALDGRATHFWCSATLYPAPMRDRREAVFRSWENGLSNHYTSPSEQARAVRLLHENGSVGDPENDFVMNRAGRVQTVSITQIVVRPDVLTMEYWEPTKGGFSIRKDLPLGTEGIPR